MITIRVAHPADLRTIVRWRYETARWLHDNGSDQWSEVGLDRAEFTGRVRDSIADGETWIAEDAGVPIGTIAIDHFTDSGLWTPEELRNTVIVHRMIVPRAFAGRGVGNQLLAHAEQVAIEEGANSVILDAWSSNEKLHDYYRARGFEHVRTVPQKSSGALFRRRVQMPAGTSASR